MWRDLHDVPRNRAVWLFLPASQFTPLADGTVTDVRHEVVVGQWSEDETAWLAGSRRVYPSIWSDADVFGAPPEQPVLK